MLFRDPEIIKWVDSEGMKTSSGIPFEWSNHRFLIEPMVDFHPRTGINKSAQTGGSEGMLLKAFYMVKKLGLNVIYTLPNEEFLHRFVTPKVDPILNSNYALNDIKGGITLKSVTVRDKQGNLVQRFLYFMGAFNPKGKSNKEDTSKGVSVSADWIFNDESSRSDQFVLQQFRTRLENSDWGGITDFDNPLTPGVGADAIYQKSDQRHWVVKCLHCGWRQYLDWFRLDQHEFKKNAPYCYVDPKKKIFVCSHCGKEIEDEARIAGEWVAKYPGITDFRGYWISQMCYVKHNVAKILEKDDDKKYPRSHFYQFQLGKPYIGTDIRLNRETITKNVSNDLNRLQGNVMGIDQGRTKWYVIGNEQGIFKVGQTESWDDLEKLMNIYNVEKVVCDALPDTIDTKRLASKYPGVFFRALYKPESDQTELTRFSPKNDRSLVLIRREEMIDEVVRLIIRTELPIQVPISELDFFIQHWVSIVRIVEPDRQGNDRFTWERIDADHLAHATVYFKAALSQVSSNSIVNMPYEKQATKEIASVDTSDARAPENIYDGFANM